MRRGNRLPVILLACLLLSAGAQAIVYRYQDYSDLDPGAWYEDGVSYCLDKGLMVGYGEKPRRFEPASPMTRCQLVTILWRIEGKPVTGLAMQYTDVDDDDWYANAARWALSERLMDGFSLSVFAPDEPVTREQLASILYQYAASRSGSSLPRAAGSLYEHSMDRGEVSGFALEAVRWACASGILNGDRDSNGMIYLHPQALATRAAVAATLLRFCHNMGI